MSIASVPLVVDSGAFLAAHIDVDLPKSQRLPPILNRVAGGDRGAFADFYDATASTVYGVALAVSLDTASAGVVTQEVYTRAWAYAPTFSAADWTVDEWMTAIMRNILTESCFLTYLRSVHSVKPPA